MLSEDAGTCITCQEWVAARMSAMENGDVPDISRAYVNKEKVMMITYANTYTT